ncbi:MAG: tRNA (adenosine(37)-N6)-threonylcarbamoyltransferase complex dimerization subunit type 1 TsaB [Candidatus Krumholzibacteriota bacterium]|nr:tRNA (adenosine(37)-N6)-threonylcarbamoyltransferase complex dimerization subunit type 1 TsaB [Candidatus Krumholzibacteriota bacterium]
MMENGQLVLALDTSHLKGSVAVFRGSGLLCEVIFDASDTHSATLMPAIDICMANAKAEVKDIDLFALVTGPGSFTGLRIGMATVKAFASIRQRPVLTVNSMELLASAFPFSRLPVFPLIDARRSEVYAAVYDLRSGRPLELVGPRAISPEGAGRLIGEALTDGPVLFCGTGAVKYRELLRGIIKEECFFAGDPWSIPSAALIREFSDGREPVPFNDLPFLEPMYIRPPDAKIPAGSKLKEGGGQG